MSWDMGLKIINSKPNNEPLNYLIWIDNLATYGSLSYVYNDVNILRELVNNSNLIYKSPLTSDLLLEAVFVNDIAIGATLKKVLDESSQIFDGIETFSDLEEDSQARSSFVDFNGFENFLSLSPQTSNKFATSNNFLDTIFENAGRTSKVSNSPVFCGQMLNSPSSMIKVMGSQNARSEIIKVSGSYISANEGGFKYSRYGGDFTNIYDSVDFDMDYVTGPIKVDWYQGTSEYGPWYTEAGFSDQTLNRRSGAFSRVIDSITNVPSTGLKKIRFRFDHDTSSTNTFNARIYYFGKY